MILFTHFDWTYSVHTLLFQQDFWTFYRPKVDNSNNLPAKLISCTVYNYSRLMLLALFNFIICYLTEVRTERTLVQ